MFERLLEKNNPPAADFIKEFVGLKSYALLAQFEDFLENNYTLSKEIKFPFGNRYGWGYKYGHKTSHLCYVFLNPVPLQ